ncbi:MAG: cell division protein FtsW, partial [Parvibaculaceae bacterium]
MSLFGKFDLGRTNRSVLSAWWWTVDRWTLAAVLGLAMLGVVLSLAASPAVASKIGLSSFHFVYRQAIFLAPALVVLLGVSMLSVRQVRRLAILGFAGVYVLMVATLVVGPEIKGATRWLSMAGFSLQPSEFIKPLLVILLAWMFSEA